jgi:hypothetical protein
MRKLTIFALAITAIAGTAFAQTADVQVIHNSPDPAAEMVDIYLDSDLAIPSFGFREATPVLELPAEVEIAIGVAPAGSAGPEDIIASFPVTLADGGSYLVMATGVLDDTLPGNPDGLDTAFTLNVFPELDFMAASGTVDANVYHGSPDAPTVDVQVMMGPIVVDDLAYGEFTGYANLPASDLVLEVTPGSDNDTVVVAYDAPLSLLDGAGVNIFASGFLGSDGSLPPFGLFVALEDGSVLELHEASVATENTSLTDVKAMFE